MAQFDCLEKPLSRFFYRHGQLVSRYPYPFLIFPILMTAALSIGFLHKKVHFFVGVTVSLEITDATYMFTPENAPSKYERAVIHEKWPLHEKNYIPGRAVTSAREFQVIVKARNDENILLPEYTEALKRLNDFLLDKLSVEYNATNWGYRQLCLEWRDDGCFENSHTLVTSGVWNAGMNITFPSVRIGAHNVFLGSSMGGARLWRNKDGRDFLVSAKAWLLIYQLNFQNEEKNFISGMWERAAETALLDYVDPFIEITFFHSQTLTEELKRNADTLVPKFVISFTILILFAVANSLTFIPGRLLTVDWVTSKPILGLMGVVSAGMAVASGIGLLNFVGFPYNTIVLVMPFLAVSIGVDNMFLMVASIRRTQRGKPIGERVGESLADVAISITITALTDALSFGVGAITSIPAVRIFCVYTCLSIILTFTFQLTFFLALVVFQMRLEESKLHCVLMTPTFSPRLAKDLSVPRKLFALGSRPPLAGNGPNQPADRSLMVIFFRDWFAPILMHPLVKGLVLIWFGIYLSFGVWGCTQIREGLEPVNLLVQDSYAIPHYSALEKYFWSYGTQVQVVVNNAPDLTDPRARDKVTTMMNSFTNTKHTLGPDGIVYWMSDFRRFVIKDLSISPTVLNEPIRMKRLLCHFLSTQTYQQWSEDIFWRPRDGFVDEFGNFTAGCNDPDNSTIEAFRFLLAMKNFELTTSQRETTDSLREIASRYPEYNLTTFMPIWLFTDQYRLILPNTLQNIVIALGCMILIALLLIPQPLTALWVAVAIASIDVGVVGYMTLWDVNLDAISMITIIMSIGFSVDFSAHICYGYVVSEEEHPSNRVRQALGALGWPITQGALSTIFGVVVLSTVDAYMIVTFFKTVFLVILLGAIHGLVFLPVLLSLFVRGSCVGRRSSDQSKDPPGSANTRNGRMQPSKHRVYTVDSSPGGILNGPPLAGSSRFHHAAHQQLANNNSNNNIPLHFPIHDSHQQHPTVGIQKASSAASQSTVMNPGRLRSSQNIGSKNY